MLYTNIVGLVKKTVLNNSLAHHNNEQLNKIKYTDLDYLVQRTKNNSELLEAMIMAYLEQTPPLITTMKQSLLNQDWKALKAAVHKMIPSFSIMGISANFESMAKKVQEYANTQQQTDDIHVIVLQLENVCQQACRELEEELKRIKKTNA